jgi:hypothetical protein
MDTKLLLADLDEVARDVAHWTIERRKAYERLLRYLKKEKSK